MSQPRVRIAVFGAGRIGVVHAQNVANSEAELVGIADIDTVAAQRVLKRIGHGRVDTVEQFLSDPGIDAVLIATPTDTHADLIVQAAAAKKAIFCEKPISLDVAETVRAIEACERAGVALQIGFQRRYDVALRNARDAIASGKLGEVRYLRLVGRDSALPPISYIRTSGGQFKDQMVHDFDAARWLLAPLEVREVFATGSALVDPAVAEAGDVDTAVAVLRFTNGTIAVVEASRQAAYGYDARSEIHGSQGMMLSGYEELPSGVLLDSSRLGRHNDSFIARFRDAYRAEIEDFVRVVRERGTPRVTGSDALGALRIAIAADRSRATGCAVPLGEVPA